MFLVDNGYWQPKDVDSPRWIFLLQWNHMWRDGECLFHREFFGKEAHWIEWTNKNPEEAARLWPRILKLLRGDNEEKAVEILYEVRNGAASRQSAEQDVARRRRPRGGHDEMLHTKTPGIG